MSIIHTTDLFKPSTLDRKPRATRKRRVVASCHFDTVAQACGDQRQLSADFSYEWTNDPDLLGQYYILREQENYDIYGFRANMGIETEQDRLGDILVATCGDRCIGGVRLHVNDVNQQTRLPLETESFRLFDHFPQLGRPNCRYAQASWLTLHPDIRGGAATFRMFQHVRNKCLDAGADTLFGIAPAINARLYMRMFKAMEFPTFTIHTNVQLPSYENLDIQEYLFSVSINSSD